MPILLSPCDAVFSDSTNIPANVAACPQACLFPDVDESSSNATSVATCTHSLHALVEVDELVLVDVLVLVEVVVVVDVELELGQHSGKHFCGQLDLIEGIISHVKGVITKTAQISASQHTTSGAHNVELVVVVAVEVVVLVVVSVDVLVVVDVDVVVVEVGEQHSGKQYAVHCDRTCGIMSHITGVITNVAQNSASQHKKFGPHLPVDVDVEVEVVVLDKSQSQCASIDAAVVSGMSVESSSNVVLPRNSPARPAIVFNVPVVVRSTPLP